MTLTVLLFPGAGTGSDHPSLLAVEEALRPVPTVRADFPYRRAGRRAPDREPVLVRCVEEEAAATGATRLVLGGRSMGGRMCSIAVAEGRVPAAVGLVLIAYPLHPPGRPERLRTAHFSAIGVPCLFVSGTRDAFGTPAELEAATALIPAPVTRVWVDGAGHDLRGADDVVAQAVKRFCAGLDGPGAGGSGPGPSGAPG